MSLSYKLPFMFVASSLAIGGVAYSGYRHFSNKEKNKSSFSEYSQAFLNPDADTSLWSAKLLALASGNVLGKSQALKDAKKDNSLEFLKNACKAFYAPNFFSNAENDFLDFKNYCSKNNKDVVGSGWIVDFKSIENAEKLINKIKGKGEAVISQELLEIFNKRKDSPKTEDTKNDLNAWCKKTGESIYLGENSIDLKTGKDYCKETV